MKECRFSLSFGKLIYLIPKSLLKVFNFVFRLIKNIREVSILGLVQQKLFELCGATKSYTFGLHNTILSTVVQYLCKWNCMALHSFLYYPSFLKMTESLYKILL